MRAVYMCLLYSCDAPRLWLFGRGCLAVSKASDGAKQDALRAHVLVASEVSETQ